MAPKWNSTKFQGVRYREHPTRRHGVSLDRYFVIRSQVGGKRREEGLGWGSDGWSAQKAAAVLAELKRAHTLGEGAQTLAEKRELARKQREAGEAEEAQRIPFEAAAQKFLEWARANKKDFRHDEMRLRLHVLPMLGSISMNKIEPAHLEQLRLQYQSQEQSPASILHNLQLVRAVFNHSIRMGLYQGDNPTKQVRFPKPDNKRVAFFSYVQAETILSKLWELDLDTHDFTLLSLHAGLRFGESAALRWEHVDVENEIIHVVDPKNGESRKAFMTPEIKTMFVRRKHVSESQLVFPSKLCGVRRDIPKPFRQVVEALGFNDGITDPRQRYYFHTCRHTFGSWLAMQGEPILVIRELMGHKSLVMTMRYAHLCPDTKREAVQRLHSFAKGSGNVVPIRSGSW